MKCKKCAYEWQSYGESLTCPGCGTRATLTSSEKQTLWEEAYGAEKIKDYALRARCYFALAEMGDEKAQYAYGECLRRGVGVAENREEALFWYKAAARRLYPAAAYRLASSLSEGKGFAGSEKQVFFWLRIAAEFGEADAAYELSRLYEEGAGAPTSHRHALFWLMRAAKSGHGEAKVTLAKMYYEGDGVEQNLAAARYFMKNVPVSGFRMRRFVRRLGAGDCEEPAEITVPTREEERLALAKQAEGDGEHALASHLYFFAARGGSMEATYRLGRFYETGLGVPKSPEEARRRYGIAAATGHKEALLALGEMAEEGVGGPVDAALALEVYGRLSALGVAEGAYRLGVMYHTGKLIPADVLTAISHYKTAAEGGHAAANDALADISAAAERIYGSARSLAARGEEIAASEAYRAAALLGHAGAAFAMGDLLEKTANSPEERKEVFTYYRTAAEGGNPEGVYRLGLCYSRAYGVKRNYVLANDLLSMAARCHIKGAEAELAQLRARKHRRAARRFYSISSVLYRKGDLMEAIKFRNIAAKLGSARARYVLGCHFEFGDGIPTDRVKAGAWYTRAAQAGFDPSRGDLKGGFLRERKKLILKRRSQMQ